MRLADFIRDNHEAILVEWEAFARTLLPAAGGMTQDALRDHADQILTAIANDMVEPATPVEPSHSTGDGVPWLVETPALLAEVGRFHATVRVEHGFTLSQVVAEYRALRASVLRLWNRGPEDSDGVIRFNEAIDAAMAEAVQHFTEAANAYRDQLLGVVSHDLRNPLDGILMGSNVLSHAEGLDSGSAKICSRIEKSAKRMARIVDDLMDLTRVRLGSAIQLVRRPVDVGLVCEGVIAELDAGQSGAEIRYRAMGDLAGDWDGDRLAQVFSNLIGNAVQHGDRGHPIRVAAAGDAAEVRVSVTNGGAPIPPSELDRIFDPLVRRDPSRQPAGLGLGLFIAKELVMAHGGTIAVTSTEAEGTTFTVRLPRRAA